MKNLLIYINPDKCFDKETEILAKIQIDNSLELGWKKEDILLITNFKYSYNGINIIVVNDNLFCSFYKYVSKINVIVYLFKMGLIKDDLYWFHDFDAFQNNIIEESELELEYVDVGFTDYGRKEIWNGGSFFFKKTSGDIFNWIKDEIYKRKEKRSSYHNHSEEVALMYLTQNNINNINSRIKRLNITYNFGVRKIKLCYEKAIKPLKILHFHPDRIYWGKTALDIIMNGKNDLGFSIMNQQLIKIFNKYGYK